MDDFKEHLRRLAVHDDALVEVIVSEEKASRSQRSTRRPWRSCELLPRSPSTPRPPRSSTPCRAALAAGATSDEIVATLEAVTPVTGTARVVSCAPKLALALGYDVEEALEELDP